jgi:predicted metalloendopeptidase
LKITRDLSVSGRRYDENGNLRQWWSNKTLQHYHEEVECMVRQYGSYHLSELGDNFTVSIKDDMVSSFGETIEKRNMPRYLSFV